MGSTDETGNAGDDQDDGHSPRTHNQSLDEFLIDIVEILRRFVSISLLYLAINAIMLSSLRALSPLLRT